MTYSKSYYRPAHAIKLITLEYIVPRITLLLHPESVCDLGCGDAMTLRSFAKHGVKLVQGFDASIMDKADYFINPKYLSLGVDFSDPNFSISERYDLAISLEVAEHLEEKCSEKFVDLCTSASDCVLFSAALPGQLSATHINNQPGYYWRGKFDARGYVEIDFIRPEIAFKGELYWPYRQNMTLFVHHEKLRNTPALLEIYEKYRQNEGQERIVPISEWVLSNILMGRF